MSANHYRCHVLVLPEDDANRQIANGFILNSNVNERAIQILQPANGWKKVIDTFKDNHVSKIREFSRRLMILLIDFDLNQEDRLIYVKNQIPMDLKSRVFILGVLSEPERLRSAVGKNFEWIGEILANDCSDDTNKLWGHKLLKHNKAELDRMILSVRPFLFNIVDS
jgi:hypothetical protein